MNVYIKNILRFCIIVILQVFILNKITLHWFTEPAGALFIPFIYPLYILLLPFETPVWVLLILGFLLGVTVDSFMTTAGIHAFATVLIAYLRVPAFVATLGVMYVARGVALLMTNGLTYNNLGGRPELGNTGFDWLGFNRLFNVPLGVLALALLAALCGLT